MAINYIIELKFPNIESLTKDDIHSLKELRDSLFEKTGEWNATIISDRNKFYVKIRNVEYVPAKTLHMIKMHTYTLLMKSLIQAKSRGNEYLVQSWLSDWINSYVTNINKINSLHAWWRAHVSRARNAERPGMLYESLFGNFTNCHFKAGFEKED